MWSLFKPEQVGNQVRNFMVHLLRGMWPVECCCDAVITNADCSLYWAPMVLQSDMFGVAKCSFIYLFALQTMHLWCGIWIIFDKLNAVLTEHLGFWIGFSHGVFSGVCHWLVASDVHCVSFGCRSGTRLQFPLLSVWLRDHGPRTGFVGSYFSIFSFSPAATRYTLAVFLFRTWKIVLESLCSFRLFTFTLMFYNKKHLHAHDWNDSFIMYNIFIWFADADELQFKSWMAVVGWIKSDDQICQNQSKICVVCQITSNLLLNSTTKCTVWRILTRDCRYSLKTRGRLTNTMRETILSQVRKSLYLLNH